MHLSRFKQLPKRLPQISRHLVLSVILFVAIFLVVILPAFSQKIITVRVLIQALETAQWRPLLVEFHEKNPGIHLEIVEAPTDTNLVEDLYTSAFLLGDSPYDLVYMDIVWLPKFAAAGWLLDLSDRVSPEMFSDYLDGTVIGGTFQNKLYRMPFRADGGMLYYRTDLLAAGGHRPPDTFEDLVNISQDLQAKGLAEWGYVWQGKQYEGLSAMFTEILAGYGGFWVNPETLEVGLDQPAAIEAVKFLRRTIVTGISPPGVTTYGEEETRRLFQSGNTVFLRNWPYVFPLAQESSIAGKFAIKPMVHGAGYPSGSCLGGWGLGISATSKHPDAAWQVIEYFNRPEVQRQYVLNYGYVPARRSLFTDPTLVAKYDFLPQLLNVVENSVLRAPIAQYAQASDILQRYLSAAITGTETPEKAMQQAARETRALLGR